MGFSYYLKKLSFDGVVFMDLKFTNWTNGLKLCSDLLVNYFLFLVFLFLFFLPFHLCAWQREFCFPLCKNLWDKSRAIVDVVATKTIDL